MQIISAAEVFPISAASTKQLYFILTVKAVKKLCYLQNGYQ